MNDCLICGQFSPEYRICPECQERLRAGCLGGLFMWLALALGVLVYVIARGR